MVNTSNENNKVKNNLGMLDYCIAGPVAESAEECLQGEIRFQPSELITVSVAGLAPQFQNKWLVNANQWVLVSASTHKQLLVLPIKWEDSVAKVNIQSETLKIHYKM